MKIYDHVVPARTQAAGALALTGADVPNMPTASKHAVAVVRKTATAGTIGIRIKPARCDTFMTLRAGGNATIFDMSATADPQWFGFEGPIDAIEITPTSANGTFDVSLTGW